MRKIPGAPDSGAKDTGLAAQQKSCRRARFGIARADRISERECGNRSVAGDRVERLAALGAEPEGDVGDDRLAVHADALADLRIRPGIVATQQAVILLARPPLFDLARADRGEGMSLTADHDQLVVEA